MRVLKTEQMKNNVIVVKKCKDGKFRKVKRTDTVFNAVYWIGKQNPDHVLEGLYTIDDCR